MQAFSKTSRRLGSLKYFYTNGKIFNTLYSVRVWGEVVLNPGSLSPQATALPTRPGNAHLNLEEGSISMADLLVLTG